MTPSADRLLQASDATWPAARRWDLGPWTLREGQGGGQRVSSATARGPVTPQDITEAEAAMREIGQRPLFMIRDGETELDEMLAARGYVVKDPVTLYQTPIETLTDRPIPRVTAFEIWPPLAIMTDLWAAGGVGPDRLAVMHRAETKTGILARWNEKPGGVGFAAVDGDICMVHAVEVPAHQRRQGVAGWIMRRAAFWGAAQGARHLAVLCVEQNAPANALYRGLGFASVGRYHYRTVPE